MRVTRRTTITLIHSSLPVISSFSSLTLLADTRKWAAFPFVSLDMRATSLYLQYYRLVDSQRWRNSSRPFTRSLSILGLYAEHFAYILFVSVVLSSFTTFKSNTDLMDPVSDCKTPRHPNITDYKSNIMLIIQNKSQNKDQNSLERTSFQPLCQWYTDN